APQYEWRVNGQPVGGGHTAIWNAVAGIDFNSGDIITVRLKSDILCAEPDTVISNNLTMQVAPTGVDYLPENEPAITLFPNPNNGSFVLNGMVRQPGEYRIIVTTTLGQKILEETTEAINGKLYTEINLKDLVPGI